MVSNTAYKSISELCDMHIKLAKAGCCLTDRVISGKVYDAISKRIPLGMSLSQLDSSQRVLNRLENLLLDEEAYNLVESVILDFYSIFIVTQYSKQMRNPNFELDDLSPMYYTVLCERLTLNGPPFYCCHYDECRANIFGHDNEFETYGIITNDGNLSIDEQWAQKHSNRLKSTTAKLKMVKLNSLVVEGHRGLRTMKKAFAMASGTDITRNYDIVRHTFTFQTPIQHIESPNSPNQVLSDTFAGESSFARKALVKAVAAKNELKAMRPFIFISSVWTSRIAWLEGLINNLKSIYKAKIGILCPYLETIDRIKEQLDTQESVSISITSQNKLENDLDYMIIYQAHSIGITEAIESMIKVKSDGCVVLIGDPKMPNLRVQNHLVREACGSILHWFYNSERYPEYFKDTNPCVARNPVSFGYDAHIFTMFNDLFYDGSLVNIESYPTVPKIVQDLSPITFKPIEGCVHMRGCSPFNKKEVDSCLEVIKQLVDAGMEQERIGVLATYCAQKQMISDGLTESFAKVHVGIPMDFENKIRDIIIISTVETAERTKGGKRYPYNDLLYDKLCLNLALTRATCRIIIIGDVDVLNELDHWRQLLDSSTIAEDPSDLESLAS